MSTSGTGVLAVIGGKGSSSLSLAFVGDESLLLQCVAIARDAGFGVAVVSSRSEEIRAHAAAGGSAVVDSAGLAGVLRDQHVDVLLSVANEFVIPADVLALVDLAVNFHDGPLPAYQGLAVTTWALVNGESSHGVTWHTMTAEVDAGDVVVATSFQIGPDETAFSLNARCYEEAIATFPAVLDAISGERSFTAQPSGAGQWFGRYERPLQLVDPTVPAAVLDRAVRATALGPRVRNRVGAVRWVVGDRVLVVDSTAVLEASGAEPGTLTRLPSGGVRLVTVDGDLVVESVSTAAGDHVTLGDIDLPDAVGSPAPALVAAMKQGDERLARHETFWSNRLATFDARRPTHLHLFASHSVIEQRVDVPSGATTDELAAAVLLWWARTSGHPAVWFELSDRSLDDVTASLTPLVRDPLGTFDIGRHNDAESAVAAVATELAELRRRGPFLADLVGRDPATRHHPLQPLLRIEIGGKSSTAPLAGTLAAVIDPATSSLTLRARADDRELTQAATEITTLLAAMRVEPSGDLRRLDVLGAAERAQLDAWNSTQLDYDRDATVDRQFREQAARTPDSPAVSGGDLTLSYSELAAAVDRFAARLREAGAARDSLVGIALERDVELLVAVLGVLTVGAAYVPLDPDYPPDRLAYMVADSGIRILVAGADTATRISQPGLVVLAPERAGGPERPPAAADHTAADLAYVIYTSGSTGRPKGVMLQHGNVVNFFAAMDDVIGADEPGTWLAVTSLSFDISVLELLWTVTRGFHVVIQRRGIVDTPTHAHTTVSAARGRRAGISLFFFAAGDAQAGEGYRLLRESARLADANGFEAIWVPERHFHAFGAAYPNPSVLGAAVAVLTTNVGIRAGSVVLPLHPSARVAEEWSVVDNLSNGRVGISFAPGWQPNDFVLNPSGYATAKQDLQTRIDEVRALWRGEPVEMVGPAGEPVSVHTLPRPVQAELPVWLTSAGTTATFERAGTMGVNLLTHLLGQSTEQLALNIDVYRTAWRDAGHAGDGHVTVMLHTFLDQDTAAAKRIAELPMKRYLGSATGLLKNMASAFPTFAKAGANADEAFRSLSDSEMDELLTVAASRYLDTSGLFGSVDDAMQMAASMASMGVDEIACLIDFGIETDDVLASLDLLVDLKQRLDAEWSKPPSQQLDAGASAGTAFEPDESMAALVARHGVTHLQCTPSLAAMLMADQRDRRALGAIRHLMVGGEALPEKLGHEIRAVLPHRFTNMYGPTETTIWSLVHEIEHGATGPVPIGRAIANTTLFILDPAGQRLPIGALGELHIGGDGVARGYLHREELTAERFVDRPGMGRLYATGDLARVRPDGVVEFAGRVDFQVKIRGHRIELGEIEAQLDVHPSVERSVVVARGDGAEARLVAFVVAANGADIDEALLRKHVGLVLPDVMVPDFVVPIAKLPLTPNGKVDRAALPQGIDRVLAAPPVPEAAVPQGDLEQLVADLWLEQLERPVGRSDNFFDIGGHSLLAVSLFRRLQESTGISIALTDVFRYPTVAGFAAYLRSLTDDGASGGPASPTAKAGSARGAMRRQMLARRGGGSQQVGSPGTELEFAL